MALIYCPECNNRLSDKAEFCPSCGYKKDTVIISECYVIPCPECTKDIYADSKYCSHCGHKIVPKPLKIQDVPKPKRQLPQCPNCKRDVGFTSEKCPYCGHSLVPQKPPLEELNFIQCPKCGRDITRTSEKCHYCGFRLKGSNVSQDVLMEKSKFEELQEGCAGFNKGLFQFGCAMTLLMALLGLLLFALGIL